MDKSVTQSKEVLNKVRTVFLELRRDQSHKRSWYPKALKDLAASALERGHTQAEVARAAGVSEGSIRNWRRSEMTSSIDKQSRPLELKLIEGRQGASASSLENVSSSASEAIARIEFPSGVRMALPVSAISEQLIKLFQAGAS